MNENELFAGLRNADASGDTTTAKKYADQIRSERQTSGLFDNLRKADANGDTVMAKKYADQIRSLRSTINPIKPVSDVPTSNWDMTANAVNKALVGTADAILNTPNKLFNLAKAGIGVSPVGDVLKIAGRPDLLPQVTPDPNYISELYKKMGIGPADYKLTPGQGTADTAIQGATIGALTGGRGLLETLLNMGMGALSTTSQNEVSKSLGENWGTVAGMAVPFAAGKAISLPSKIVTGLRPKVIAGKRIAKSMTFPTESRARLLTLTEGLPGAKPTLPQLLRDPEIAKMSSYLLKDPEALGRFKLSEAEQAANRRLQLGKAIPGEFGPETVAQAAGAKLDAVMQHINNRRTQMESAEVRARQNLESWTPESMKLGVSVSGGSLGAIVQGKLTELQKQVETDIENKTLPLREAALDSPHPVNLNKVIGTVSDLMGKAKGHEVVEKALGKVAAILGKFSSPVNPEDMTREQKLTAYKTGGMPDIYSSDVHHAWNIRKTINDMIEGNTDDPSLKFANKELTEIKKSLDVQMNEATGGGWEKYLNAYKNEVVKRDPFYRVRGKIPLAIKTDEFGRTYAYSAEELPTMFFSAGEKGAANARSLKELLSGDPEVTGALKGYVADRIKGVMDKGGDINKNLNTWIRDYAPVLKEYGLYDDVKTPVLARNMMQDNLSLLLEKKGLLFKHLDEKVRVVQKTALGKMMGADPDIAFRMIMNSKDVSHNLSQLVALARQNPETLAGLRVAARDFVFERHALGTDLLDNYNESLTKQMAAWKRFGPLLEKAGLYDPDQMKTMNLVFKDIANQNLSLSEGREAGISSLSGFKKMSDWFQHRMMYMATNNAARVAESGAALTGLGTGHLLMAGIFAGTVEGLNAMKNAVNRQLINAVLDPEIAAELVKKYDATRAHALAPVVDQAAMNSIISLNSYIQSKQENQK